jgi:hypothetical protein
VGGSLTLRDDFASARTLAAGLTIRENDDPDLVASENVSADGASAAQYLIVRVGNNDSDAPTGLLGWGHGLQRINAIPRSQLVTIRRTLSWSIGTRTSSVKRSSRTTECLRS